MRFILAILLILGLGGCVCFAPCPMAPSGWAAIGVTPPGINFSAGGGQFGSGQIEPEEEDPSSQPDITVPAEGN